MISSTTVEVILSRETHFRKVPKKATVKILSIFLAKVILKYQFCKEVRKFEFSKNFNNLDELGKKMLEILTILNILTMLPKLKMLKMLTMLTLITPYTVDTNVAVLRQLETIN